MNGERLIALCRTDEVLPDAGRAFDVHEYGIALFRTRGGELFALSATCPHGRGPLADGMVTGHRVACPLHNWSIDLRTGEVAQDLCARVRTYDIVVRDSVVYVRLPVDAPAMEIVAC